MAHHVFGIKFVISNASNAFCGSTSVHISYSGSFFQYSQSYKVGAGPRHALLTRAAMDSHNAFVVALKALLSKPEFNGIPHAFLRGPRAFEEPQLLRYLRGTLKDLTDNSEGSRGVLRDAITALASEHNFSLRPSLKRAATTQLEEADFLGIDFSAPIADTISAEDLAEITLSPIDTMSVHRFIPYTLVVDSLRVSVYSLLPPTVYPLSHGKICTLVTIADQWAVDVVTTDALSFIETPYRSELNAILWVMGLAESEPSYHMFAMGAFRENDPDAFAIVRDFLASWVMRLLLLFLLTLTDPGVSGAFVEFPCHSSRPPHTRREAVRHFGTDSVISSSGGCCDPGQALLHTEPVQPLGV